MSTQYQFEVLRRGQPQAPTVSGRGGDALLLYALCSLLIFGPLAFGAVEPWSMLCLQATATALFVVYAIKRLLQGEFPVGSLGVLWPLVGLAVLISAQLLFGWTIYRGATAAEFLLYIAYGMLLAVALGIFRYDRLAWRFLLVMTTFGFLLALFAIVQRLTFNGKLYWLRPAQAGAVIFGPYVNHNHYAGLMEMLTPMALVLALDKRLAAEKRVLASFVALVMGVSIFLSLSRGGMVALAGEIVFLIIVLLWKQKDTRKVLVLSAVLVAMVGFLAWLGGDTIASRLGTLRDPFETQVAGSRIAIVRDGIRMVEEKPIVGWGLGTFPTAYPRFRSYYTNLFINEAHNDWLQALIETGIVGFLMTIWFVFEVYRRGFASLQQRASKGRTATLAALTGVTGILLHSFSDFNLHIPANAALFFVLCALAASEPL